MCLREGKRSLLCSHGYVLMSALFPGSSLLSSKIRSYLNQPVYDDINENLLSVAYYSEPTVFGAKPCFLIGIDVYG